jgi:hypothetical protein
VLGLRSHLLVGNPVAIVGNWKVLLAYAANWLSWPPNTVNRLSLGRNRESQSLQFQKVVAVVSEP